MHDSYTGKGVASFSDKAFANKKTLFLTMGHEYVHAAHYQLGYNGRFTEYGALSWELMIQTKLGDVDEINRLNFYIKDEIPKLKTFFFSNYPKYRIWEFDFNLYLPLVMPDF